MEKNSEKIQAEIESLEKQLKNPKLLAREKAALQEQLEGLQQKLAVQLTIEKLQDRLLENGDSIGSNLHHAETEARLLALEKVVFANLGEIKQFQQSQQATT